MPLIRNAEEAIDAAERMVSRYHAFRKLERVVRDKNEWIVEFDVSILGPLELVRIRLEAETGVVTEYTKVP